MATMQIYELTNVGDSLSKNTRPMLTENNRLKWRVIYYLKDGCRSKEQIVENTGASSATLISLLNSKIIRNTQGVAV